MSGECGKTRAGNGYRQGRGSQINPLDVPGHLEARAGSGRGLLDHRLLLLGLGLLGRRHKGHGVGLHPLALAIFSSFRRAALFVERLFCFCSLWCREMFPLRGALGRGSGFRWIRVRQRQRRVAGQREEFKVAHTTEKSAGTRERRQKKSSEQHMRSVATHPPCREGIPACAATVSIQPGSQAQYPSRGWPRAPARAFVPRGMAGSRRNSRLRAPTRGLAPLR